MPLRDSPSSIPHRAAAEGGKSVVVCLGRKKAYNDVRVNLLSQVDCVDSTSSVVAEVLDRIREDTIKAGTCGVDP